MQTPDIETDRTIEHNGRIDESGGAVVADAYAIAYIPATASMDRGEIMPLQDWHGAQIGTFRVKSGRRVANRFGAIRYQIDATINGRRYYGTTDGQGMAAHLKAYKHQ